jgi:DNA-binding transcriptional LysR family regulator
MIDNLKALAAVIDSKSLTKAASRLFLTQSAISRRIQQLEETLGGTLLDRTQRPPAATALGQRVYEQALPILRAVDQLVALTRRDAAPTGTLRIGMSHAIGDIILVEAIEQLSRAFPGLDIRVRADRGDHLADRVSAGELDAAIVIMAPDMRPMAPLIGRGIATIDVAIVQSRRHPRVRPPVHLTELAEQDWILNPLGCRYRAMLEDAMGERDGTLRVAVDTYGIEIQLRMIAAGLGLGLLPKSVLRASPNRDAVSVVRTTDFGISLGIWLIHLQEFGNLKAPIQALAATVADNFTRYAASETAE